MVAAIHTGRLCEHRTTWTTFTGHTLQVSVTEDGVLLVLLHRRGTVVLFGEEFQGTPLGKGRGLAEFS